MPFAEIFLTPNLNPISDLYPIQGYIYNDMTNFENNVHYHGFKLISELNYALMIYWRIILKLFSVYSYDELQISKTAHIWLWRSWIWITEICHRRIGSLKDFKTHCLISILS